VLGHGETHLGVPFDTTRGGQDLIFPHHENEIAQTCRAHGARTHGPLLAA
jgi:cysteinyl-tRNA synthetase